MTSPSCSDRQNPRLAVRPLAIDDLDGIIAYFTELSRADANRMGLELNRVPSPTQLRSDLNKVIAARPERSSSFLLA
ncbi:MAG TPA: hypothetical protein VIH43_00005, partial [Chthoniobacterales bacterium]